MESTLPEKPMKLSVQRAEFESEDSSTSEEPRQEGWLNQTTIH